ncbi:MAG TPA: iron transporter [Rhizomicrobium sp.]|jgi:uncharacterized protein involved in high-affinity Fe2+ transport|nr:iron transporter [Rhizomicrobium sp.]
MRSVLVGLAVCAVVPFAAHAAEEFNIGAPVMQSGLKIVPNYLTGIEMDRHPPGMDMGKDNVHLEADVHATKDEPHGFSPDEWIPYLTIDFTLTKKGSTYKKTGTLYPMTAKDGPHYANNVDMDGPGTYELTYKISPPSTNGFIRHIDAASGVPAWWSPVTAHWTFVYPIKK